MYGIRFWTATVGTVALVGTALALDTLPARAGGGACHDASPTEASGDAVTMKNFCFQPTVLRVAEGTTVSFTNVDDAVHELRGLQWGANGAVTRGSSNEQRFDTPGTYPYSCPLHFGMMGVVVVGNGLSSSNPATAVRSVSSVSQDPSLRAAAPAVAPTASAVAAVAAARRPDLSPLAWTAFGAAFSLIVTVSVLGPVAYLGLKRR